MKSKSVLVIIPHLGIGGTEIQTLNLVGALRKAGYEVNVLCLYRNIPTMVKVYEDTGARLEIISPQYNSYDVDIQYPSKFKSLSFLYRTLKNALTKYKPSIIHVQYMTPGAAIILMLKYVFGFNRILATAHTDADIYSSQSLKLVRFIANHCLMGFQCITKKAEEGYFGSSSLYDPTKCQKHFTIYNALPQHITIALKPRKYMGNGVILLGVVSRLTEVKGIDLVVPAFIKALQRNNKLRLLVVGDGSLRKLMEQQIHDGGIDDKVEFAGFQPQDKLQSYYDRIDIILMPSRSEGFGLTAIEGMARGCVPVVANVGGLPEVVEDGISGYIHEKENVDDLAAKIGQASDELKCLSEKAVIRANAFSFDHYKNNIESLYSQCGF